MLKRFGDKAEEESAARAEELATKADHNGAATWRRITDAVRQLADTTRGLSSSGTETLIGLG
jgi:hypothetical protein